jgi:hypothetical protein
MEVEVMLVVEKVVEVVGVEVVEVVVEEGGVEAPPSVW